jgi:hypothetical protein
MPTIAAFAANLCAIPPRPVVCLDTCDILEVVQCLDWEQPGKDKEQPCKPRSAAPIEPVRRLLTALIADPDRVQLVITELVATEWNQNIAGIRAKAELFLRKIDEFVSVAGQAAGFVGTTLPAATPLIASSLVADAATLSTSLLNAAKRLDLDDAIIRRALNRVMTKRRPSHDGHIKDSINFEHYLEFARRLRAGGFPGPVLFVSKNRKDYWAPGKSQIHPDLEPDINDPAVQLQFHGSLTAALGPLGI